MGTIKQINISGSDVKFVNKGTTNRIFIAINLSQLWKKLSKATDIYIKVNLQIPIIENNISANMLLELERTYKVVHINPITPIISIQEDFIGQVDSDRMEETFGAAKVMHYTVQAL